MGDDGHADRRRNHEANGERGDRTGARAQVAERGEEGGAVEERRQHAEEHELGLELDLGHPRDEPEDEPADDEQDGVRHAQRRRDDEHRRDRQDEAELDEPVADLQMHRRILPAAAVFDGRRRTSTQVIPR